MSNKGVWISAGLLFLGAHLKVSLLSHSFVFGVGHAGRPIVEVLIYLFFSFVIYGALLEKTWRERLPRDNRAVLIWILMVGVMARLLYFPSQPVQETDPYRYIWDGQMSLSRQNPYSYSPQEAFERGVISLAPAERQAARTVNERVNHPGIKTIYPPGAQFLFVLSQILSPWGLAGWRAMVAAAETLILVLMVLVLRRLRLPPQRVILYAWSPLIIKEFSNSLHLDVFAVLFICLTVYALTKKHYRSALLSLAVATSVKWFAIILLPFLLIVSRQSLLKNLISVAIFGGVVAASFLPFMDVKAGMLFEGLFRFSTQWKVNDGLFTLMTNLARAVPLSLDPGVAGRVMAAGIFGFIAFWSCRWLSRRRTVSRFLRVALLNLAALFFLIPTGNPWYFTWVFPFLVIVPSRALVAFSGLVFLYYLDFYFMYQNQSGMFDWVRLVEYGLFFIVLGVEWGTARYRRKERKKFLNASVSRVRRGTPTVGIIIPVYNESKVIKDALKRFVSLGADEVIVVDGKSADGTYEIVKGEFPGVTRYQAAFPERSSQMNLGASGAKSDILIFAHIDMDLPRDAVAAVREKVQEGFIGGGFKKSYDRATWLLRVYIYFLNQVYLAWTRCLVGTNAMFVVREVFEKMDGFCEVALLEDMIFSECLKKQGRVAVIDQPVVVSSRKYFKNGVIIQILRNIRVVLGYKFLGESPGRLREIYQG